MENFNEIEHIMKLELSCYMNYMQYPQVLALCALT